MLRKELNQFRVLRQKRKLGVKSLVLSKSGLGTFSPKRVTNSFFRVTGLNLKSSGPSLLSNDLTQLSDGHAAFILKHVFWGPWLPILQNLHKSPVSLPSIFSAYKLPRLLTYMQQNALSTFAFPFIFLSWLNIILASKIQ